MRARSIPPQAEVAAAELNVVRASDGSATRHRLMGRRWLLGRSQDADIQLDDGQVAESHAELQLCPFGRWWIHDHGSSAGTFVNGHRVHTRILLPHDTIAIGHFILQVRPNVVAAPGAGETMPPPPAPRLIESLDDDSERIALVQPRALAKTSEAAQTVGALQLNAVLDFGRHLIGVEGSQLRREALCAWLVGTLGATRTHVVRLRDEAAAVILAGSPSDPGASAPPLSRSLLQALWHRRELVTATSVGDYEQGYSRALLACPLGEKEDSLDAIYVELGPGRSTESWRALVIMVVRAYRHADLAWTTSNERLEAAAVEQQLQTARNLQHRLIPTANDCPDGLDVVTEYQPCLWVGGDYIDAFTLPDGRAMLVVADVCGKGLQGAMVASSLHTLMRATVGGGEPLPSLIGRMNRYLARHLPDHSYVTLVAVVIDPETGRIEHINAGHPPAVICGRDGELRRLQCGRNVALGMWETPFEVHEERLAEGEILILYTDGLSEGLDEGRDPTAWAMWEAVSRFVREDEGDALTGLADELRRMLQKARGTQIAADDAAFILARGRRPLRRADG